MFDDDKEPSTGMQTRVLLAFALSALVLVIFAPKTTRKPQPPAASKTARVPASTPTAPGTQLPAAKSEPQAAPSTPGKAPASMQGDKESDVVVESDLYEVHLSNRGGVATSWVLKHYKDDTG